MRRSLTALFCLVFSHALVDAFSQFLAPLWPRLQSELELSNQRLATLFILWSVTTSVSQLGFGYLRDRRGSMAMLLLGPSLTVLGMGMLGFVRSLWQLVLVIVVGGLGIGAFHPDAAIAASRVMPESRTRCLSIFMCGGTMGLAVGPFLSGWITERFGLPGLLWTTVPGLLLAVGLYFGHRTVTEVHEAGNGSTPLRDVIRGKIGVMGLLLSISVLRVVPSVGVGMALAFWLKAENLGEAHIGAVQGLFLFSGGIGMLLTATFLRSGWERASLVICPLVAAAICLILPLVPVGLREVVLVPAGFIISGTMPVLVSYSQQLLPRGVGLASSITMGLSWGLGGTVAGKLLEFFNGVGHPEQMITAFAPILLLSTVLSLLLPTPEYEPVPTADLLQVAPVD